MKAKEVDYWPDQPLENPLIIGNDHPRLELPIDLVERIVYQVLDGEEKSIGNLNVILTDADHLRNLNKTWKGTDYDTDVLSFSLGHGSTIEGEVYVSLDFAEQHCQAYQATFIAEACRYIVHGLLHLLGYCDRTPEERQVMRRKEDKYLECTDFEDL